ncbi:pyrimidine reductase family protein [Streptomyces violaceusniger]|uniref:Bifunctional deaminase-reductase domain protein n=1 Tax=Streptomyces violaceusniger (strain Tu 4113) TaxID=653045 RepID=G2NYJ1_STRV4|nr:pyrimidine reductase family protein [Streptomyces violaceusniger]AEM82058.1 bifunctional deaminase-reductase domain protein [Streptomyces violaceusniger Tu 4113]
MRRLFPVPARTSADSPAETTAGEREAEDHAAGERAAEDREWGLDELADAYAYPEPPHGPSGAFLRANMVSSLDGAAHHDGRSKPLSSDADMRIFGVLRGLADAVVVGAGTVRLEGYRPARAREAFAERRAALGQAPAPAIAVVSASLDLDFSMPLFTEPLVPTVVITGAAAAAERIERARAAGAEVVFAGAGPSGRVDAAAVVTALAELGHTRLLTEGGPTLLAQFAAAGVLDELCLAVAPLVTAGDAKRIMDGAELGEPEQFTLDSVLEEAGFLFTRYRRIYQ